MGATNSSHDISSSVSVNISPQSHSSNDADFQFSCPKSVPKGQQSLEQRNSMLATTAAKTSKQSRKRRRSSVEQNSPVVISSKSNDVLVSPTPVDGLKDMPQPFISLTDMIQMGTIPTTINALHQPANHQVQNCFTFSGNPFDNEQHTTQQYNKESHKTVTSEDNLNSMISRVSIQ